MMTRRRFLVLLGSATPVAAGAAIGVRVFPGDSPASAVPAIRWNEHGCDHCGMVISDRRYAAAWIEPDGHQQRFDDVGCMASSFRHHTPAAESRPFVRDFAADAWLEADSAVYAHSDALRSPMAYGIAAFTDSRAAHSALGDSSARTRTWEELVAEVESL